MNSHSLIDSLDRFGRLLPGVVREVPADHATWRPSNGAWSILEVIRHLADEEAEDFRPRLESILRDPEAPWPPIDPPRWAVERHYNEGSLDEAVDQFTGRRAESVVWLRGLVEVDWTKAFQRPKLGVAIRAGDLLTSWAAHDMLHLRQIAKRMYELTQDAGGEFVADYAGEWKA